MSQADVGAEQSARMRAGISRGVLSRVGGGLRRAAPPALLALLCASAFGPVVAAAVGTGAVVVAGIAVLGSVGAQTLSDVIASLIDRLRAGGRKPTQAEFEAALVERIEQYLNDGGRAAQTLRADIAAVLRHIDAAGALETAVRSGDEDLQHQLTTQLAELSRQFGEFGFVLDQVRRSTDGIQEMLRQQDAEDRRRDAERRADRNRARQWGVHLRLIREQLAVISRTRGAGLAAGPDPLPNVPLAPVGDQRGRRRLIVATAAALIATLAAGTVALLSFGNDLTASPSHSTAAQDPTRSAAPGLSSTPSSGSVSTSASSTIGPQAVPQGPTPSKISVGSETGAVASPGCRAWGLHVPPVSRTVVPSQCP